MSIPLNILLLEDDALDAELNIAALEGEDFDCTWDRVQSRKDFVALINRPEYDIILADYNLPSFNGIAALELYLEKEIDKPFILVSGSLGEDLAVEAVKMGATDYVLKDRLVRLGPAVKRALAEYRVRRQEQQRTTDLNLFRSLNDAANRGANIYELISLASKKNGNCSSCYGATIYLLDEERNVLLMQKAVLPEKLTEQLEKLLGIPIPKVEFSIDEDMPYARALQSGKTQAVDGEEALGELLQIFIDNVPLVDKVRPYITSVKPQIQKALGISSVRIVPLVDNQRKIGVMEFSHTLSFSDDDIERIESIAAQVTAIISRRQSEDEVRRISLQHQLILDSAGEGIFGLDLDGRFTFLNPSAAKMLGVGEAEWVGKHAHSLHHHTKQNGKEFYEDECPINAAFNDGEVHRVRNDLFWREDKSSFPVSYTSTPIKSGGILAGAVVTFRDVSEQVEATREIARLAEVVEKAAASIAITNLDGDLVYVNPFFEKSSGYTEKELLGNNPRVLNSQVQSGAFYRKLWDTVTSGGTWQGTFINKRKDGSLYHEDAHIFPITTPEGEIINYASVKREITAEVKAREKIEQQLSRLEALHTIDSMISSSTDLNLILNLILKQVQGELDVDAADLLVFRPSIQSLQCVARVGFRTDALAYTHLRLGKGLAGRAALTRKMVRMTQQETQSSIIENAPELENEDFATYFGIPLLVKGQLKGVLEIFHRTVFEPDTHWQSFLETLAGQAAIAIDNDALVDNLQKTNEELRLAYDSTLEGWAHALELRDMETEGHSRRVTLLTTELATAMEMDERAMDHIRRGALLHDIGKMGIPDAVLNKPGPLTVEERKIIEKHPDYAYEMLSQITFLKPALDIPYSHHERWDGSGYPLGLRGDSIPLAARIFSVIDVYDALRHDRVYRKAWTEEETLSYIQEESGAFFDPQVVETFLVMIEGKKNK